jgi:hypothetical protein
MRPRSARGDWGSGSGHRNFRRTARWPHRLYKARSAAVILGPAGNPGLGEVHPPPLPLSTFAPSSGSATSIALGSSG